MKLVIEIPSCELGTVTNKKTGLIYGCSDVWEKYLKGENDAKET